MAPSGPGSPPPARSRSRYWPAVTSVRMVSQTARARVSAAGEMPERRSSSSDQTRARSPTRMAAPRVGAVHDVVVHQGAGVDELEGGDRGEHSRLVLGGVAGAAPAPVGE